jgi:hypothetical protein
MAEQRVGSPLTLRHASKRSSGTWGPDDYDVIDSNGRDIGRIFKPSAGAPEDHPRMWTITGAVVAPRLPSHGFCATLDEAKAKFAETWRAWPHISRRIFRFARLYYLTAHSIFGCGASKAPDNLSSRVATRANKKLGRGRKLYAGVRNSGDCPRCFNHCL